MYLRQKLFWFYLSSAFVLASLGYLILKQILPDRGVFGALFRMFVYHEEHPLQYIGLVSIVYALIATPAVLRWRSWCGWRQRLLIVSIIGLSILVASIPGGMLWVVHDIHAGFLPSPERTVEYLAWGAGAGLQVGWLIVAQSFPYSFLGFIVGYLITNRGFDTRKKAWLQDTPPT